MKAAEIQVLKDLVDKVLPEIEAAEIQRLPLAYQSIVTVIVGAIGPQIQAKLDELIAKLPVDPAP